MKARAWVPSSAHDQSIVREELERILASTPFSSSQRYPALLRYVVEQTLSGNSKSLKERTLGVEVFHRPPDYDTNSDPVVRFSAGEVRRRLAQYYLDGQNRKLIEINLPLGTYIPEFSRREHAEEELPAPVDKNRAASTKANSVPYQGLGVAELGNRLRISSTIATHFVRKSFLSGLFVGTLVVTVVALFGYSLLSRNGRQYEKPPTEQMWRPLLNVPDDAVIAVGRTQGENTDSLESPNTTIEQHILRPDARISLAAVQAVSQVVGFLQTHHKRFRINEAYSVSLENLRHRPVVLVSGFNNIWTIRLLRSLPFHLDQANGLHYIVDAQHPDRRDWSVDFNLPYRKQTTDYAIIGRYYDSTTDSPVVVVAGIGSNGSEAAGEFVVSPEELQTLARLAPQGSLDRNFEAVLKVEVIGGNTGSTTVVASRFW